jgi:acetoin utilization deacetylase AcuC-like enzyme
MLLNSDRSPFSFEDYGIDIPVSNDKREKVLEVLRSHPILKDHIDQWYIDSSGEEITREDLLRVHSKDYVDRLFSESLEREIIKTYELMDNQGRPHRYHPERRSKPLSDLFNRALGRTAGTYQCCRIALEKGFCFYLGGGMHHARRDTGNGFCLINDTVIAVRKLQASNLIQTAWVIDLDVHKGDGTAALTAGDKSITTLSAHMARGWPLDGERYDENGRLNPSFTPSDIDIPVDSGEEHLYVQWLAEGLNKLSGYRRPDIAVVLSGADPYEKDKLPSTSKLKLTKAQMLERDQLVYGFLSEGNIPKAYLMAGGYGENTWEVYTQFLEWVLQRNLTGVRSSSKEGS